MLVSKYRVMVVALACAAAFAAPASAQVDPAAFLHLKEVYAIRPDLQKLFHADDLSGTEEALMMGYKNLEAWASRYGYKEYPGLLGAYEMLDPAQRPPILRPRPANLVPIKKNGAVFDPKRVTAKAVYVVDVATRQDLLAHNERLEWPIASITKLMTTTLVVDRKVNLNKRMSVLKSDEVGGARLQMKNGAVMSLKDLMYATIVGSANNAANAVARSTGLSKTNFVKAMNAKAEALGLKKTRFVDPTGIETGNVSTAQEVAALAMEAFNRYAIKRMASTARYTIVSAKQTHRIKNTNGLLTDEDNGLIVLGGKTGYLVESKWNLATKIMDGRKHQIMVVVLGSSTQPQSFKDAETAARWVWDSYDWVAPR